MKTCATRSYLATPAEHLLMLLLMELTLYVRPCAMEMPALLAALLQDAGSQHHVPFEEFPDALLSPASIPANKATAINELNERKEMLDEALDKHAAANEVDFEGFLPPVIATAGVPPLTETMPHKKPSSSASSMAAPARHCSIEIIKKVPGVCQNMPHDIGSACVAGDYMDVFNMECMAMNGF